MDNRPKILRSRGALLGVCAVLASFACAAQACLPDVEFGGPPAGDAGPDVTSSDAMMTTSDGGVDARADVTTDAMGDSAPIDGSPDTAPPSVLLASSEFYEFGGTGACAVRAGTLYCWGDSQLNAYGQFGFPDEDAGGTVGLVDPMAVTTTAQPADQIVSLTMGEYHTCAIYGTKTYCWGDDYTQQLGNATDPDGGPTELPVDGLPLRGLTQIAAGSRATCGVAPIVTDAGNVSNVYCWGYNGSAELGRPVDEDPPPAAAPVTGDIDGGPLGVIANATQIAGALWHFCALTSSNQVFCWGSSDTYESGPVQGPANCPGGDVNTCTAQPLEVTLPMNGGQIETPIELALGDEHSCALAQSGNVYCWGANDWNQLGVSDVTQLCPGGDSDAGIPCTGTPVQAAVSNIQHIYAAGSTTCALDSSRNAWCWGDNEFGVLATGDNDEYPMPKEIFDLYSGNALTFDDMAMGWFSACARDGTDIYCWGSGVLGTQLADGGVPDPNTPALVQF